MSQPGSQLPTQQPPSQPGPQPDENGKRIINVRKLAALDIVFHGRPLIVAEFAVGVLVPGAIGALMVVHLLLSPSSASPLLIVLGAYFLCLALNYVPLLVYAIALGSRERARKVVERELAQRDHAARRYGVQSLLLLVPLAVFLLAIVQAASARTSK